MRAEPFALLGAALALLVACGKSDERSPARSGASPPVAPSTTDDAAPQHIDVTGCDGVLVIALDSAPADVFSFLGGAHATTPRLAELARESVVVTDHVLASTGLNGALAALLTARHSREHGVGSIRTLGRARLRAEERTLAEGFADRGWRTLLAAAAPQVHPELSGFGQGFASIHVASLTEPTRRADQVVGACLPTLRRWVEAEEPFFALVQLSDLDARGDRTAPGELGARWLTAHLGPHAANIPRVADALAKVGRNPDATQADLAQLLQRARGSEATRAWRAALRDGRASALDAEIGRLFDLLAERKRLDRTLIVLTGLRGGLLEPPDESVGPRFLPEVLRTPLVVRFPRAAAKTAAGRPSGARHALLSAVDAPRLLDSLFRLQLGASEFGGADLAAVAEGRAPLGARVVFLASADLSLAALATPVMQLERSGGGEDLVFHRSGRTFSLTEPAPELAREDRARFARYASSATIEVHAPGAAPQVIGAAPQVIGAAPQVIGAAPQVIGAAPHALEVAWRIDQGLLTTVEVRGVASEDLTPRRESARRRSGRARIGAGGALAVGMTERTADVRLDISATEGVLGADWLLDAPLARSLVPRVLVPRVVAWPADDSADAELALVDVQRAGGTSWRLVVNAEGRCEALLTVWPPRAPSAQLEVSAGGRVVAEAVPGRLDVVRLVGDAPFDVRVQKGPDEQFAFAVRVGGEVLDARRMRIEGQRMASDTDLSLVVPGWLPGVTEGLFDRAAQSADAPGPTEVPGDSDAARAWRVLRTDPAGLFGAEQALAPDVLGALRTLPAGE